MYGKEVTFPSPLPDCIKHLIEGDHFGKFNLKMLSLKHIEPSLFDLWSSIETEVIKSYSISFNFS